MKLYLTQEFIRDLREADDSRLVRQVLSHTIDDKGKFYSGGKDDHRYDGIEDGWIRYVSRGKTAFRVIFVRKGETVYLHRAGKHSVEDEARTPKDLSTSVEVTEFRPTATASGPPPEAVGRFLKTWEPEYLNKFLTAMYHLEHEEIILISPFIATSILEKFHHFGRFLDKAIEESGTIVRILTRPPTDAEMPIYKDLEARGAFVFFRKMLHAKMYLFEVNKYALSKFNKDFDKTAIIGSSNLTLEGCGFDDNLCYEEVCYKLPTTTYDEAKRIAESLINGAEDFKTHMLRRVRN